jgi:hypothetical protein
MHHTCTLCKLKPMEHFLPQIEPYRQLIDDTAMDAYDSAVTTMRKQLAKNYNALVNTNRELYTVLRVDETHKREFGSQVNWVNMEVAQQEHERMQHMVTVVKRAGGTVGRAIIPAPPPPAPSPATSLTERELCQQRHDKNIEKLNTLHARLNTNPAMVRDMDPPRPFFALLRDRHSPRSIGVCGSVRRVSTGRGGSGEAEGEMGGGRWVSVPALSQVAELAAHVRCGSARCAGEGQQGPAVADEHAEPDSARGGFGRTAADTAKW